MPRKSSKQTVTKLISEFSITLGRKWGEWVDDSFRCLYLHWTRRKTKNKNPSQRQKTEEKAHRQERLPLDKWMQALTPLHRQQKDGANQNRSATVHQNRQWLAI